ncbi:F-box protein [Tripterygium wilfordii]|uniref:F-box protein n=1 Tax=Tripterygium wilfordii TaxID=458696 RepID=A0A7J7BUL7_TRIWF|nr:F-box protein [Tripterygium wilfordii]
MGLVLQLPTRHRAGLKENQGGWSDVHEDILSLIKARLCYVDQLRFNSVCRGWRSVSNVHPADKWPFILGLGRQLHLRLGRDLQVQSYNLYDPSNNKEYFIGHKFAKLPDETAFGPVRFRVYASKHGWVFLAATSEITVTVSTYRNGVD